MQTWEFQFAVVTEGETKEEALTVAKQLMQERWFEPVNSWLIHDDATKAEGQNAN